MANSPSERWLAFAAATLQSILCFAGVALVFAFPPPERTMVLLLLIPMAICMAIAFVNTTLIATGGDQPRTLKFCRYLLWVPTIVMGILTAYGILLWINAGNYRLNSSSKIKRRQGAQVSSDFTVYFHIRAGGATANS